ncbi:MAG: sialidase family protein [Verrucomicrobiales bacterium]
MRNWFATIVLTGRAVTAASGQPSVEKFDLFDAGHGGYALYRIPGMVVTQRGTVLAYCEARRTGKSDWDSIDILLRRSTDVGQSWGPPGKLSDVPGSKAKNPAIKDYRPANANDVTYNNPVTIAGRNGAVHFLYCLEYMRGFYLRSQDDGVTWSGPREITRTFDKFRPDYDWKVIATGPGHGIELKNGRLLAPVWLSTGTGGGNAHRPSVTATIFSDDDGKTWQRGQVAVPNTAEWINPSETAAVQLGDGSVMLNVRSESKTNRRLVTTSRDGATDWSMPRFDHALREPICMASIVRLSQKPSGHKDRIVFANPDNLSRADGQEAPGRPRDRRNLTIKLSYDEGETWPVNKVLEPGVSGYCDLAVTNDGTVLCLYERGSTDGKSARLDRLTLACFNLEWLSDGKDALP